MEHSDPYALRRASELYYEAMHAADRDLVEWEVKYETQNGRSPHRHLYEEKRKAFEFSRLLSCGLFSRPEARQLAESVAEKTGDQPVDAVPAKGGDFSDTSNPAMALPQAGKVCV